MAEVVQIRSVPHAKVDVSVGGPWLTEVLKMKPGTLSRLIGGDGSAKFYGDFCVEDMFVVAIELGAVVIWLLLSVWLVRTGLRWFRLKRELAKLAKPHAKRL